MTVSRRHFLKMSGAYAIGFGGLHTLMAGCRQAPVPTGRFGPLLPDPAGILDLPSGFSYAIVSRTGDPMTDGFVVPGVPDGMAAFAGSDGQAIVVRNHEVDVGSDPELGPFGPGNVMLERLRPEDIYDVGTTGDPCLGGTTTFVWDVNSQQLVSQHLSLAGTVRNCAGGPTPWNTWITCEESVVRTGADCAKDHGYPFEVPAMATPGLARPVPLIAMGRFMHEAVAVDPVTHAVYQTEDTNDGCIYRFIPNERAQLSAGGRLQALMVQDSPGLDTRNWNGSAVVPGVPMAVSWVDLDNVESPDDDLRYRAAELGAAVFARGEGMWYGNDAVYFACTNGGAAERGQIWRLEPSGRLELFVEPNDPGLIDNADNLTVAPWGDLIVCEDGSGEQFLVGITPEGDIYKFARNAASESELAGATFSHDGSTLFVNIQYDGLTLAITGPWV